MKQSIQLDVYKTNENFRKHYQNVKSNKDDKKHKRLQSTQPDSFKLTQTNFNFQNYDKTKDKLPSFQPKTSVIKYFQDKILLDNIQNNFAQTKLDNFKIRNKMKFNPQIDLLSREKTSYSLQQNKTEQIIPPSQCINKIKIDKYDYQIQNSTIDQSKFKVQELKQDIIENDSFKKKLEKFNKLTINHNKRIDKNKGYLILVIKNSDFILVNSFNSMKFCYYYFLKVKKDINQNEIFSMNQKMLEEVSDRLKLNNKKIYLFQKDGKPIENFFQLEGHTLIVSNNPLFHGFDVYDQQKSQKLKGILDIIEMPLKKQNKLKDIQCLGYFINKLESKIKNKFQEPINYIQNLLSNEELENMNEDKYQNFNSKRDYLKSNLPIIKENSNIIDQIQKIIKSDVFKSQEKQNFEQNETVDDNEINLSPEEKENLQTVAKLLEKQLKNEKIPDINENDEFQLNPQLKPNSYVLENIQKPQSDRAKIAELTKYQVGFYKQNIPETILKTGLNRHTLHQFYTLFQVLTHLTLNQKLKDFSLSAGVNFESYKNGLRENFIYNDDFLKNVFNLIDCNHSGYLGWQEFLNLLIITRNKNLEDKINLFIKIADQQKSGYFTHKQIFDQAKLSLKKIVHEDPDALEEICKFFTSLIFKAIGKQEHETIQFHELKNAITNNNQDSNLLAMFCGADI